jgi:hypothetical protein
MATVNPVEFSRTNSQVPHSSSNRVSIFASQRFRFCVFESTDIAHLVTAARDEPGIDATAGLPHPYAVEGEWTSQARQTGTWDTEPLEWATCRSGDGRVVGYGGLHHINVARQQA